MILVTGATGKVGRELVELLARARQPVRALIRRDADRARLPAGVEGVAGDLNRPETLSAALDGVRALHLLAGYDGLPDFVAEARRSGVEHIVLQPNSFMSNTLRWIPQLRAGDVVREPFADRVRILAAALGRNLRFERQSDGHARAERSAAMPAAYVDAFFSFFAEGKLDESKVLDTVQRITGRPPRSFEQWATVHAEAFVRPSTPPAGRR
jgi:hypothetical protein